MDADRAEFWNRIVQSHPLSVVGRFAVHTIVGVTMFALVGAATVLLSRGADLIAASGISPYVVLAVRGLEFFLFAADVVCAVALVSMETWTFLREIVGRDGRG